MPQQLLLMNPHRRGAAFDARHPRGPHGRFLSKRRNPSRRRRRNPESERERSLAARRGWAHRRRHRNPESERERSRAAMKGWARRRRRRNPLVMDLGGHKGLRRYRTRKNPIGSGISNTLICSAYGAVGALALDAIFGFLPLPASIAGAGTPINYAAKGAGALALGYLAEKVVGSRIAKDMADGALTVIMHEAGRAAITKFSPNVGARLGDLQPIYITPGTVVGRYNPLTGSPVLTGNGNGMGDLQYTGLPAAASHIPSGF